MAVQTDKSISQIQVCQLCGQTTTECLTHHWPQELTIPEAAELGQTREVCVVCHGRLRRFFPSIEEVPWETQEAQVQKSYELEKHREEMDRVEEAFNLFRTKVVEVEGLSNLLKDPDFLQILRTQPQFDKDLLTYLIHRGFIQSLREEEEDKETYSPDYTLLAQRLRIISTMTTEIKSQDFWRDKVGEEFLPYIGVLEYHLRAELIDSKSKILRIALTSALENTIKEPGGRAKKVFETILEKLDTFCSDLYNNPITEDELIRLVQSGCEALKKTKEKNRKAVETRQGRGTSDKVYYRWYQLMLWIKEGNNSFHSLLVLYQPMFHFDFPEEKLGEDLYSLGRYGVILQDSLDDMYREEVLKYLTRGTVLDASLKDYDAVEVVRKLAEVCRETRDQLKTWKVNPGWDLQAYGEPTAFADAIHILRNGTRLTDSLEHPYGTKTWEELKQDLLDPELIPTRDLTISALEEVEEEY